MAERRMFAKAIINSARFLRMPTSSRLLYYDLGMSADDDGVVEAFTVMRTTGATEDDLRVLSAKGFVSILNDDLVAIITDWKQNNQIRPDRYKPSVYAHLLVKIEDGIPNDNQMVTDGIPMVDKRETQDRLGKDRLGKDRLIPPISPKGGEPRRIHKDDKKKTEELFERFWKEYPRKAAKQNARKAWDKLNPDEALTEQIIASVERFRLDPQWTKDNGQFIPHAATFLNGKRWEDETEVQMNAINRRSEPEWDDGLDEEGREAIRLAYARECGRV